MRMAGDDRTGRYKNTYKHLLRLYPESFRREFAEPMQQTFIDLCNERIQAGGAMFGFVLQTYTETFVGVVKERASETALSARTHKTKIILGFGGLGVLAFISTVFLFNNPPAQSIASLSSLEQARQLSKGKRDACLVDDQDARNAVREDDATIDYGESYITKFELAASGGIYDVPAGTHYDLTINAYEDGVAVGTLIYDEDYGTYNYTIKKLADAGEWEFASMVACRQ